MPPIKLSAIQTIAFLILCERRWAKPGRKYHQPKNKVAKGTLTMAIIKKIPS
jgi:hypothetical protein